MKSKQSLLILAIFALALGFSTVPETVKAVSITNTLTSSVNTGGEGRDGRDGADGVDGKDGQSGTDGKTIISGEGTASVKLKSVVNGETVVDVEKSSNGSSNSIEIETEASTQIDDAEENFDNTASSSLDVSSESKIFSLLTAIRLRIIAYVSQLF